VTHQPLHCTCPTYSAAIAGSLPVRHRANRAASSFISRAWSGSPLRTSVHRPPRVSNYSCSPFPRILGRTVAMPHSRHATPPCASRFCQRRAGEISMPRHSPSSISPAPFHAVRAWTRLISLVETTLGWCRGGCWCAAKRPWNKKPRRFALLLLCCAVGVTRFGSPLSLSLSVLLSLVKARREALDLEL
jgi:hypothetical protein